MGVEDVAAGSFRLPRHMIPCDSRNTGLNLVSMTWRSISGRPHLVGTQEVRVVRLEQTHQLIVHQPRLHMVLIYRQLRQPLRHHPPVRPGYKWSMHR